MHLCVPTVVCCVILAIGFTAATQNLKPIRATEKDLYIEDGFMADEGFEGSGAEVKKDLEASGSGLGPDDEDAEEREGADTNELQTTTAETPLRKPSDIEFDHTERNHGSKGIGTDVIMNPKSEDRPTSFFAQPGILAAVIGGAVVGLLCAILVVMFIVYRMRKKDEGSYALDEPKRSPTGNTYAKGNNREFYA